jgi:hypothetical protein
MKSVLYLYLSRKTGQAFDPEGFRLPGSEIPESEVGDPFAGLDIDGAEPPLYQKETEGDFYRLDDGTTGRCYYLMLSEEQLMRYCKDNDASPNTVVSVFWAKAVRRADPTSDKTLSVAVACDHKAILGNNDSYRMFADTAELDFPRDMDLSNISKACTVARGQLMLQTMPENALWTIKQKKARRAPCDADSAGTAGRAGRTSSSRPRSVGRDGTAPARSLHQVGRRLYQESSDLERAAIYGMPRCPYLPCQTTCVW